LLARIDALACGRQTVAFAVLSAGSVLRKPHQAEQSRIESGRRDYDGDDRGARPKFAPHEECERDAVLCGGHGLLRIDRAFALATAPGAGLKHLFLRSFAESETSGPLSLAQGDDSVVYAMGRGRHNAEAPCSYRGISDSNFRADSKRWPRIVARRAKLVATDALGTGCPAVST
jgi:hypothetical protein